MQRYGAMWASWDGPTRLCAAGTAIAAVIVGWKLARLLMR